MKIVMLAVAMFTSSAALAEPAPKPAPVKSDAAKKMSESNIALRERMGQRQLDLLIATLLEEHNYYEAAGDTSRAAVAYASSK